MTRSERGFTLIEILVALVISAMGLVAVAQMIGGATRAQIQAESIETAAMLASGAIEYALLPEPAASMGLANAIQQAEKRGWKLILSRQPAPVEGFQTVHVAVTGPDLPHPVEVSRLIRMSEFQPELSQ